MMSGMYAAISGLDANETMLNNTASDLANVNTVGFKSAHVTFADSLTQVLRGASGTTTTNGGTNPLQLGLGVQVAATENEMSEGAFQSTNSPLDIAIQGKGFLRVGAGSPPGRTAVHDGLAGQRRLHARRQPHDQHEGASHHPVGSVFRRRQRRSDQRRRRHHLQAGQRSELHRDPARLGQRLDRPGRICQPTPTRTRSPRPTNSRSPRAT